MNSPCGDHAVLVLRVSAMAVLATDLGGGMAEGILCVRVRVKVVGILFSSESGDYCKAMAGFEV
jgi:hypothetical protein